MSTKPTKSVASSHHGKRSKRMHTQKPPLAVSERLKRLFTSLVAQLDGGHHKNAIKTCDKILRLEPADKDALQTKLFLLLQTDQYAASLALAEAASNHAYNYERVYSLYRLHREFEAAQILNEIKKAGGHGRGVLHLEAQLSYRQGSFQNAFDLYNQLLDTAEPHSDEQTDILTNLEAAQKHLDFVNSGFLHALDALPASVTKNIESDPPPTQPTSTLPLLHTQVGDSDLARPEPTVKNVRKKRVPKGVVPGVTPPPDPERWLKKSERASAHVQSGKRKKAGGGGATQGIVESVGSIPSQAVKSGGGKAKRKK